VRRDLSRLTNTRFDLLVVGAGIHGACIAWDACLRGLSVAVVDQGDFGAATSANSLRIVHGGLRYLARGDLPRMIESIRERSTLLRIAPALVQPLPVLVPTYRTASRSRVAYRLGLAVNDLISWTRNRGLNSDRRIPGGRLVSREDCLRLFPRFATEGLSGGALWYDAQLRHPERLTLSFLRAAAERGTVPANYVRMDRLRVTDDGVQGASVTDLMTGSEFEIRAHAVIVAAGPWTVELLAGTIGGPGRLPAKRALAVNVMIDRSLAEVTIGAQAGSGADEDPVCGGHRFLFAVPVGRATLLGTWYTVAEGSDPRAECERGAGILLQEFNQACPGLDLSPADVARFQWGWLPLKAGIEPGRATALAERPRVVDHGRQHGIQHLFSVEGTKYTTARRVAERVVDRVFSDLHRPSPACRTAEVILEGAVANAEVLHAVREEMALKLSDIVFRRTSLGSVSRQDRGTVEHVAHLAGQELGWDGFREEAEVEDVMRQMGVPGPPVEALG
jgi:glycerol-3-phosphate dehydrogenase